MAKFIIKGNKQLKGSINISGAKNAALKIIPAAILASGSSLISNVPDIIDIHKMLEILESIGAKISFIDNKISLDTTEILSKEPDQKLIKKLRGSIVLIGPLLAKFGKAVFSQPGGCLIGARPIDDHLDIFRQLGIKITEKDGIFYLKGYPKSTDITLSKMSVTATENAIMATVFSKGTTRIHVAAAEPEIADLADFLNKMGAKIRGAGTHEIVVEGVKSLTSVNHKVLPDRIEAGTYLIAAIATNSRVTIGPVIPDHMNIVLKKLTEAGARFEIVQKNDEFFIKTNHHNGLKSVSIDTRTYPGYPTDLQSPFTTMMTQAKGESKIFETLFEGRFLFIDELLMMGANIDIENPHMISVKGPTKLKSKEISSRDIRGGAALVIAGLIAQEQTVISDVEYIDRGYEKIDQKLNQVGAEIIRME